MNHNISTEELRKMLEDAWEASRKWQQFIRHGSDTTNAPSSSNTYINSILAALDDGQEGKGLFRSGKFTLHSGQESDFKIDCNSLSDSDLEALAFQIWQHRTFGEVYGVPKGGERIAEKLRRYIIEDSSVLLIVDDVMTTGNSMNEAYEKFKTKYDHIDGAVIFNRGANVPWVHSIFTTPALPVADGEGEKVGKLIARLVELKPYHMMPYNFGDMGEMGKIIDKLQKLIPLLPSAVTGGMKEDGIRMIINWLEVQSENEIIDLDFRQAYKITAKALNSRFPSEGQPAQGGKP